MVRGGLTTPCFCGSCPGGARTGCPFAVAAGAVCWGFGQDAVRGMTVKKLAGVALAGLLGLAGCVQAPMGPQGDPRPWQPPNQGPAPDTRTAAQNFVAVIAEVEPVAERYCRERRPDLNCDFQIVVDDRADAAPNAFHTLDPQTGRPLIGFTLSLIADARNRDELAFILGHEAGHHIAGHIPRAQNSAMTGALILGTLAALGGVGAEGVEVAQQIGGTVGARRYSQSYELEADAIGTLVAWRAGFDAERGAAFFARLPDPGNSFLGSHPPNQQRLVVVQRTMDEIRAGRLR